MKRRMKGLPSRLKVTKSGCHSLSALRLLQNAAVPDFVVEKLVCCAERNIFTPGF